MTVRASMPPVIHPITLPSPAMSRTWIARLLWSDGLPYAFPPILRSVAPQVYEGLPDHSTISCYKALLTWLNGADVAGKVRLPLDWAAMERVDEYEALKRRGNITDANDNAWWDTYIPLCMYGVDLEYMPDEKSQAKALVCLECTEWGSEYGVKGFNALEPYVDLLPVVDDIIVETPKAPAGYRFVPPWDGLADLCEWMMSTTGYDFLNLSNTDVWEGGVEMPPWTADDLHALISNWVDAQAVMDHADKLAEYIDKHPKTRLPLLHKVLNMDRQALGEVTELDPKQQRTLIQVLA